MFDTVLGLPLHVLLIHAAVLGLPLVAVGSVVVAARARWRRRFLPWALAASFGCLALVFITIQSGKRLAERLPESPAIHRHAAMAGTLLWLTAGLCLVVGAVTLWSRRAQMSTTRPGLVAFRSLLAVLVITASAVTVQVVRTGHSGSDAVWGPIIDATGG
ncbi:MAG: DUF2231 domain-containing protein [Nocardioidaceae bacterium]